MSRFKLDPDNLPTLTEDEHARLDGMTNADITTAAEADAHNPPLTVDEMALIAKARLSR